MIKAKHFETKSFSSLETEINKFLSSIDEKDFISINYLYSNLACVIYKENETQDESWLGSEDEEEGDEVAE